VALLPAIVIVVLRRPVAAGAAAVLLIGALAGAVTLGQMLYRFGAHGGWPTAWDRVHGLGLMVVTLLVAATFQDRGDESPVERDE
jgi:hypothetical protein